MQDNVIATENEDLKDQARNFYWYQRTKEQLRPQKSGPLGITLAAQTHSEQQKVSYTPNVCLLHMGIWTSLIETSSGLQDIAKWKIPGADSMRLKQPCHCDMLEGGEQSDLKQT